jgi:hypothetical protein
VQITGLTVLENAYTGTGDHVCVVWSDGRGHCVGYFERFVAPDWEAPHAPIVEVAGAHYVRTANGRVFRSGDPPSGLSALDEQYVEQLVATLSFGVCARLRGGRVHCAASETPETMCDLRTPHGGRVPDLEDAVDLASTERAMCAVRRTGELRCWSTCSVDVPLTVPPIGNVAQIVGGETEFCARLQDGSVRCLENNQDRWRPVSDIDAAALYGGPTATCARTKTRELWCWGRIRRGADSLEIWPPRQLPTADGFDFAAVGDNHVCVATTGAVRCFGRKP